MTPWWWIALHDDRRPKGQRSLGVVVVQHGGGYTYALAHARRLGLIPAGAQDEGGMVDLKFGDPPAYALGRLLNNATAEKLAREWAGGMASQQDIAAAFADDAAKIGEPLFPRRTP